MKHLLLRNAFTLKALLLVSMIVGAVSGAWAQESTLTEGFENATTSTNYQGTVTVTEEQSDCGIGWEIFYGTVSTSSKITGNNSAALRLYAGNDNYGYLKTTTPIEGLTKVAFKIKAAISSSASIKVIFSYSSDGITWTDETAFTPATSPQDLTRLIPAGNKYVKFAISSTSTKPSKSNAQLTIDDVVFTYSNTDPSKEDAGLSFGETTIYNVSFGESFTAPTLINPNNLEVTYESGNNDVARVDENTGEITIVGGGEAIITASSAETDLYNAGRVSYTLNVTDNRIATSISCDPIELDINDVGTLTMLRPVVLDAEGNVVEYTNSPDAEGLPEVYFETVSDEDGILGSFDSHGNIVLNSVEGTATIKAVYNYFQLNENYQPSECTFTITITAPFTGGDVTFDASKDKGNTSQGTGTITKNGVTFACSNGVLGNGTEYRLYKDSQTTFTTTEGKITKIVFTQPSSSHAISNLTPDTGSLDDLTWTGRASSVVFTAAAQARTSQIVVTVDMRADAGLAFDESANVNATLGEAFTAPTLINPNKLSVVYASGNEEVATVDPATGAVTLVGAGDATITATFEGDDTYSEGSASYTITVTAANQVATPVIAFGATTFFESTTATITCATEGATIFYSTDNGENWQTYSDPITLTETTTIIAKATKEGPTESEISAPVTATKYSVLEGLAGMAANATTKSQTSYVKLSNAQVTARAQSGNGGEMQDATTGVLLYNSSFVAGKLYNGIFSVTYVLYQGNPEITAIEAVEGEGTITDASSEVEPALVTLQELVENFSTYLHKKIIIVGATVTTALENKGATIKQNGVEMALRENNSTSVITKLTKDAEVNVVGYPAIYSSKQQIYIYSDDDISAIVDQRADSKLALGALNSTTLNVGDKIQLDYTTNGDGDITWKSSNDNVLTVDQQGNVEAVAVGEATITVAQSETESYKAGEASIKLTVVDPNQGQHLWLLSEASYSSASTEAVTWTSDYATMVIEKANAGTNANNYLGGNYTSTRFYAKSILTIARVEGYRIASVLFQATTSGYATAFKNSTWTNAEEVVISEENAVTITPTDGMEAIVATIGGTCGFDKVFVTYVKTDEVVKPVPSLAFVDAANMPITKIELVKDDTFTATLSTDLSSTEEILISIQPEGIVSYDNNIITALDAGEATITATFAGNDSYKPASAQLKVVISNPAEPVNICEINGINPTSLTISETAQFTLDATFVEGLTLGVDYEILWESSDPTILDVHSNGLAVANGVGTAEVTVKVKEIVKNEADKHFIDMEKTFTVTVYGPATQVQGALIAKLADDTYRAVTNDATTKKNWLVGREVTVINGKVLASEDDSNISWTITTRGDVTTFQDLDGNFISAPASGNNIGLADAASESTQWTVDGDSWTKLQGETPKTILWNNTNLGFRYYASSNIDNSGYSSAITYSEIVPGCTRTLSNTWGTVCFSRQVLVENTVNARFYWVAGKVLNEAGEPVKLILREEDWALKTGYPFIVEAIDPTAPVIMLFEEGELVERALNMNGLYGTHTEREVPEGAYILSGGQFVKCGTGCSVAADRAYLKMEDVPVYEGDEAGVKVFNLGGEDGVSSLDAASEGAVIYDLSGRRVSKTAKGLYIVNGKKVAVK